MNPLVSWACFLVITGAAYLYYSQSNKQDPQRGRSATQTSKDPLPWADTDSKSKAAAKPAKAKAPRKSAKKAAQEGAEKVEAHLSGASSTASTDADDDLPPVTSPALGTTAGVKAPSGKDVSDMLAPKAAAPAILKIGASEKPARDSKPQPKRSETPTETKKQRQNKKKTEEAKAQREADEKERQILLEKQRRTAREARGEPARNGVQAKPPASSAWTTVGGSSRAAPAAPAAAPAAANNGQLLDTFEQDATNGSEHTAGPKSGQYQNLPSEEEQLRLAMEDSAWTTVPKGKKQRKTQAGGDTPEEGSDSGLPQKADPVKPVSAPAPAPVKKAENSKPATRFEVLAQPVPNVGHPMDSDWPVL